MLGWIALAVLIAAAAYVVIRLLRSWGIAFRRFGPGAEPPPDGGGSGDGPPGDVPTGGRGPS